MTMMKEWKDEIKGKTEECDIQELEEQKEQRKLHEKSEKSSLFERDGEDLYQKDYGMIYSFEE